ncbi:uncharacterized protein LOC117072374 [Trachypithecus francoisi]|uniref:uncharacterized protein LOC117072374 n=1 Tax=Trachypithecus francoisi TaxID=54180 RepID=UPI00141AC882|nr:uncharacterized protein LOC117072374 [Trachypithecus francoisi]
MFEGASDSRDLQAREAVGDQIRELTGGETEGQVNMERAGTERESSDSDWETRSTETQTERQQEGSVRCGSFQSRPRVRDELEGFVREGVPGIQRGRIGGGRRAVAQGVCSARGAEAVGAPGLSRRGRGGGVRPPRPVPVGPGAFWAPRAATLPPWQRTAPGRDPMRKPPGSRGRLRGLRVTQGRGPGTLGPLRETVTEREEKDGDHDTGHEKHGDAKTRERWEDTEGETRERQKGEKGQGRGWRLFPENQPGILSQSCFRCQAK